MLYDEQPHGLGRYTLNAVAVAVAVVVVVVVFDIRISGDFRLRSPAIQKSIQPESTINLPGCFV